MFLDAYAVGNLSDGTPSGVAPVVARTVAVSVHVRRPAIVIDHLVQTERRIGGRNRSRKVVVRHVVVADARIQIVVVVIVDVDAAVPDRPSEVVILILVRTVLVVVHLRASPIVGV